MILIVVVVGFTISAATGHKGPQDESQRTDRDEQGNLNNVKDQVVLQLHVGVHLDILHVVKRARKQAGICVFESEQQHD